MGHPRPSRADYQRKGGPPTPDPIQRWRIVYSRGLASRELVQRAELDLWEAAIVRSGLPIAQTGGAHPRPRLSAAIPLPLGLTADAERIDVLLTERRTAAEVRAALLAVMPADHALVDLHDVWLGEPPLVARIVAADYRVELDRRLPAGEVDAAIDRLLAADRLERSRRRGERATVYDLRPFLLALDQVADEAPDGPSVSAAGTILRMRLGVDPERGVGRPDEAVAALGDALGVPVRIADARRERLWTVDELEPDAGR